MHVQISLSYTWTKRYGQYVFKKSGGTALKGKIIDITVPISPSTKIFPGDPKPLIERIFELEKDGFALSRLTFGSHTGTHVDAPCHALKNGKSVDLLEPETLMGKAIVLDLSSKKGEITGEELEAAFQKVRGKKPEEKPEEEPEILLLKTVNSGQWEKAGEVLPDLAYLDESAASWILEKGFFTLGIDGFSVDSPSSLKPGLPVHEKLLSKDVKLVECLDLHAVAEGNYFFICLPLKITGCDGAPARALLISDYC